jgi:hypothetical protein
MPEKMGLFKREKFCQCAYKTTLKSPANPSIPPSRKQPSPIGTLIYCMGPFQYDFDFSGKQESKTLIEKSEIGAKCTQNYPEKPSKPKHSP